MLKAIMQKVSIERILNKYPEIKKEIIPSWFQQLFSEFSFEKQLEIMKQGISDGEYTNFPKGEEITLHFHNFQEVSICLDKHNNPFTEEEKQQILMHILLDKPEIVINNITKTDHFADIPNNVYLAPQENDQINLEGLIKEIASEKTFDTIEQPFQFIATEYQKMTQTEKSEFIQHNHEKLKEKVEAFTYNTQNIASQYEIALTEDVIFNHGVDIELAKKHFKKIKLFLNYSDSKFKAQEKTFFAKVKVYIYSDEELTCQWLYTEKATQLQDIPKEHSSNREVLTLLLKNHKLEDMMKCGLIKIDFLKDLENVKLTMRSEPEANKQIACSSGVAKYYSNQSPEKIVEYLTITNNHVKIVEEMFESKQKMKLWGNYEIFSNIFDSNSNCILFHPKRKQIIEESKECIKKYFQDNSNKTMSEMDVSFFYEVSKTFPVDEQKQLAMFFIKKLPIHRKNFTDFNDTPLTDEFIKSFANFSGQHINTNKDEPNTYNILMARICSNKESQDKLLSHNKEFFYEKLINLDLIPVNEFVAFHKSNNTLNVFQKTVFPTEYLMNKDFCLTLISNNDEHLIHKIPRKFFKQLDFIELSLNELPLLKSENQQILMSRMPEGISKILLDKPEGISGGTFFRKKLENHILLKKINKASEATKSDDSLAQPSTFKL